MNVVSLDAYRASRVAGDEFSATVRHHAYLRGPRAPSAVAIVGRLLFGVIGEMLAPLITRRTIDHVRPRDLP